MKVGVRRNTVEFGCIPVGGAFFCRISDMPFLKTEEMENDERKINCVSLETGNLNYLAESEKVEAVDAVVMERK